MTSELSRASPKAALESYLTARHESLAALLPKDTSCNDLFCQVGGGKPIERFFDASEDPAVGREFMRFTHEIEVWLEEEKAKSKAKAKRDKKDAQLAAAKDKKRPKLFGEPPPPPTMAFQDAQAVAAESDKKRKERAREELLKNGYSGKFRVPGDLASAHQRFFKEHPERLCEEMGLKFNGEDFGVYSIHFPGAALEAYETQKREIKQKVSGSGKTKIITPFPYKNYSLPTARGAEVITWQEFFGTMVATAYRASDAAEIKMLQNNTSEQIKAIGEEAELAIEAKYEVRLKSLSKKIAEAELQHEQTEAEKVKAALGKQIDADKAARTALVSEKSARMWNVQQRYEGLVETKLLREKHVQALKDKAKKDLDALHTRKAPAGGASQAAGVAALAAVTGAASTGAATSGTAATTGAATSGAAGPSSAGNADQEEAEDGAAENDTEENEEESPTAATAAAVARFAEF